MTTTIVFADTTDGDIHSYAPAYASALAGTGTLNVTTAASTVTVGQSSISVGGNYSVLQGFLSFTYTVDADQLVTAGALRVVSSSNDGSVARQLEAKEFDWGSSLTGADFRTTTQIGALPFLAAVANMQNATGKIAYSGMALFTTRLASAGPLRLVVNTDRATLSQPPSGLELCGFYSSDASGTANDPALIYTSVAKSQMVGVLGAQVQLSDGTHAFIERVSQFSGSESFVLKHHNGTTASTIATLYTTTTLTDFNPLYGAQAFSLVVDASDNLYVLGPAGTFSGYVGPNSLGAKAFTKGVGYSWTAGTFRSATMPSFAGILNQVSAAWHNQGTNGTIMAVVSHDVGSTPNPGGDISYALVNCQYLLTGTGSLFRNSGSAQGLLVQNASSSSVYTPVYNETGTQLEVVAAPGTTDRGYLITADYKTQMGAQDYVVVCRYLLSSGGTSVSGANFSATSTTYLTKDAGSKARVIPISSTAFTTVTASQTTGYGLVGVTQQNFGTSPSFSLLGFNNLGGEGIASLPPASAVYNVATWDAVHDPFASKVWVYYLDVADSHKLMRTAISLDTYQATREEIVVATGVGASGSSNRAIRVHRGPTNSSQILVAVGNKAGSTHSTVYVTDTLNSPPYAPTLALRTTFDAAASASFSWTFNDPDVTDTQGAFQLQINTASGVPYYDTHKLTGTISYVGVGVAASGNNTTLAPALPSAWEPGDLLLMMASIRNSGTGFPFIPAGWSSLYSVGNVGMFGKIAHAGESTPSVLFSSGASGDDTIAQISAFRGTAQDISQVLAAGGDQLNSSAQNITYPALNIPTNNCAIVYVGWKQDDWTSVAPLASSTEIAEVPSTIGNDAGMVWDYQLQTTAANVASGSFVVTGGGSAISRGFVLALAPHSTPAGSTIRLGADLLSNGASWQWRVRTWDSRDLAGAWSDYATFSTSSGATVTVTDPAGDNPAGLIVDEYLVHWSVSGMTQSYYRVVVIRTDTSAVLVNTGWVTSPDTQYLVTGMLTDVEYQVQVTVRNFGLVESSTGTRLITPSYSTPEPPTLVVTAYPDAGYVLVDVNNPDPTGDKPDVTSNLILRRLDGTADEYVAIGSCDPDGSFRDYAAASDITYQYIARGVV